MTVGLIWAQSRSGVIGRDGGIPWRLPEDQAHFKRLTLGHTVVMGRLTWESLPKKVRPLPGRRNVVLTRQADYMAEGAMVVGRLDEVLTDDEAWVIGGEQVYVLAQGRIIAEGPPAEVCDDATVIEAYLGAGAAERLKREKVHA